MKARLIKPDLSPSIENDEPPPDETQLVNTIRSWVQAFKTSKANKASSDFKRINGGGSINSWRRR